MDYDDILMYKGHYSRWSPRELASKKKKQIFKRSFLIKSKAKSGGVNSSECVI